MELYSNNYSLGENGNLHLDGVDLAEIAREYGTPAYVMSEGSIRATCREFMSAMSPSFGSNFKVAYASKALCSMFLYPILLEEGLHADVVSGGELYTALKAGFPPERLHFHGNCKTYDELEYAVNSNIGSVVIDNEFEIHDLNAIARAAGKDIRVLLRVKPGVQAHTHEAVQTGQNDSKFGFSVTDGSGIAAARRIRECSNLELCGIHCHIGSQVFEGEAFDAAARIMVNFFAKLQSALQITLTELILGGGFGVKYMPQDAPQPISMMISHIADTVKSACANCGITCPEIIIEPGRSIVAAAGATLYTVGGVRDIPGARCYVATDGSMADSPRYAYYGAQYDACIVSRAGEPKTKLQTIAGRCCENGDLITKDICFQPAEHGDLLCVFATGAYNYSMASNYNRLPKPPIVLITEDKKTRLVARRESYADLVRNEIF